MKLHAQHLRRPSSVPATRLATLRERLSVLLRAGVDGISFQLLLDPKAIPLRLDECCRALGLTAWVCSSSKHPGDRLFIGKTLHVLF